MSNEVQAETRAEREFVLGDLIGIVPDLLWLAAAVALFFWIGKERIRAAIERTTKISIAGIEIQLAHTIEEAAAAKSVPKDALAASRAGRRLAAAESILSGTRILWVDDHPANNEIEIRTLRQLKVTIDVATSTEEARTRLAAGAYEVVLSDMTRAEDRQAGRALIPIVAAAPNGPALIFYVGTPQDVPLGSFGLTTRPDELFHLIVDAMSRRAG